MEEKHTKSKIDQFVVDFVTKLRVQHNMDQADIGEIIGTKRTFVTNIENPSSRAKYNLKHINLLAEHFELSPKDFIPEKPFVSEAKGDESKNQP
jgi:transcriptional regulator with XRE-family HTH domain